MHRNMPKDSTSITKPLQAFTEGEQNYKLFFKKHNGDTYFVGPKKQFITKALHSFLMQECMLKSVSAFIKCWIIVTLKYASKYTSESSMEYLKSA